MKKILDVYFLDTLQLIIEERHPGQSFADEQARKTVEYIKGILVDIPGVDVDPIPDEPYPGSDPVLKRALAMKRALMDWRIR